MIAALATLCVFASLRDPFPEFHAKDARDSSAIATSPDSQKLPQGTAEVLLFTKSPSFVKSLGDFLGPGYAVAQTRDPAEGTEAAHFQNPPRRWLAHLAWRGTVVFDAEAFGYPTSLEPTFELELEKVLADFAAYYPRASIYVAVPSATKPGSAAVKSQISTYFAPLTRQAAREAGVKTIELSTAPSSEEAIADAIVDRRVEKRWWRLVSADSEEAGEGVGHNAIDGDLSTYWHTRYSPRADPYPHELVVDMGSVQRIDGLRYVPRQDGGVNGRVKAYAFFVSSDGVAWGEPVASGMFPNVSQPTRVKFPAGAVSARFFRFVAKSEQNGGPWASAAEIDVLKARP